MYACNAFIQQPLWIVCILFHFKTTTKKDNNIKKPHTQTEKEDKLAVSQQNISNDMKCKQKRNGNRRRRGGVEKCGGVVKVAVAEAAAVVVLVIAGPAE